MKKQKKIQVDKQKITFTIFIFLIIALIALAVCFFKVEKAQEPKKDSFSLEYKGKISDLDIIDGNQEADLSIIVYENYLDSFSYQLTDILKKASNDFSNNLKYIYRPFVPKGDPLSFQAALFVACANEQKKGLDARNLFFSDIDRQGFSLVDFNQYADKLTLNREELSNCLKSEEKQRLLEELQTEISQAFILGSPTLIVGDELINGARPYDNFVDSNGDSIEGLSSVIARQLKHN
jgi:protein-disulfide isomerase